MPGIYRLDNTLITPYVSAFPVKEAIRITNRLLDGSYHLQVIGVAANILELELSASALAKTELEEAYLNGTKLKIVLASGIWTGSILELEKWSRLVSNYYKASGKFLITAEGGS